MSAADEVLELFSRRGGGAYFGEPVSITEHSLQAAHYAREDGAGDALVVATLLHDVGHLVQEAPEDIADWHSDAEHEKIGSEWLARWFGPAVTDPVRLHVAAKRYLCATSPGYGARLSPASVHTLKLQGGPMSAPEQARFRSEPHFRDALRLRLWDERGKEAGLLTATLADYAPLIDAVAATGPARR